MRGSLGGRLLGAAAHPILGEEPVRTSPPYAVRLVVLVVAMIPDTLVGIVLLQTGDDPFPALMGDRPSWAPPAVHDINIAGGLMWAGGDGLVMAIAIGLMISVLVSPHRRMRVTGPWLEAVRRDVVAADADRPEGSVDPDSDEALAAYNRMLERLSGSDRPT
ncbi:hypothetical protein JCM18899A_29600 [Nocardioides sp. AN3]